MTTAALSPISVAFADYLRQRLRHGPLAPDEVVALLGPLFQQVGETHERGRVIAPKAAGGIFLHGWNHSIEVANTVFTPMPEL